MTEFGAVVVFAGPAPEPGAVTHSSRPVMTGGRADVVQEVLKLDLGLLDRVVPLASEDGEQRWLLLRKAPLPDSRTVLVVEDSDSNRAFYEEVIKQVGVRVLTAATAAQGVALCSSNRVDLAFIDVRLPDANGYELCRTLAAESGLEAMTLVLMSADPQLADNERVLAAGASDFLVNPISSRDLAEEVSRLLGEVPHHHESWIDLSAQPVRHAVEPQHVRLGLFGRPWIDTGTKRVSLRGGRSVELLATLAAACPTPVTSDRLGRYAWPPPDRASQNAVYTAMSRLRSLLGEIGAPDLVITDGTGYCLAAEPDDVDLVAFENQARRLLGDRTVRSPKEVLDVLALWEGAPLAGTRNPLLLRWVERLTETKSRLLEALAVALVLDGDPSGAAETCRGLLDDEPWRETMWALLVAALYRAGRSNDALRAYAEASDRLRGELGLDPGPRLADLEMMVLTHDPLLLDDEWLAASLRGGVKR